MKTNFTPNYPQEEYTATIKLTVTRKELSALYDILGQAEPSNDTEQDVKDEVLNELSYAYDWIKEMEDIHRQFQEKDLR